MDQSVISMQHDVLVPISVHTIGEIQVGEAVLIVHLPISGNGEDVPTFSSPVYNGNYTKGDKDISMNKIVVKSKHNEDSITLSLRSIGG